MEGNTILKVLSPAINRDNSAEGDYTGADGILYCGKCHTPKQYLFEVEELDKRSVVPMLCQCEQEARMRKKEAAEREEALKKAESMRKHGLTDSRFMASTFSMDDRADKKTSDIFRRYCDKWETMKGENIGLLLYGDVGGGKTFYAACIANCLIDRGIPVLMTTIPNLSSEMKANFGVNRNDILKRIAEVPLLILDDVGMERNTPTSLENAYDIINTRYNANKPLIITTNLSMNTLKATQDVSLKRIYSRIIERCSPVAVKGPERRQNNARANYEKFQKLICEE